jgi:dTDP-4-amino-4,6-dideoxygalactose transaminase
MARLAPSYERGILTKGPLMSSLEEQVATRLGVAHAVAVSSCTSGLMLVLQALGLRGPVVLPSFTFSASAHAVAWNGVAPVFAECNPRTFQLDPDDAAQRLGGAGAILATHVFGAPCDAERLGKIADHAGIPLVFDAAHAFGATRGGRPVGGLGTAEVFSLSPTKVLVAGEGGIVTTQDEALADAVRLGRDYGNPGDYDSRFPGLNARMSEFHAAMALESLSELDQHLAHRRHVTERYCTGIAEISGLRVQDVDHGDESTYKDFTVILDEERFGLSCPALVAALRAEGIDTRRYFFPPVHRHRAYATDDEETLPVTSDVARRVVSLPIYRSLDDDAIDRVIGAIGALHASADELRSRAWA